MSFIEISNKILSAKIHLKGAELFSLKKRNEGHDWLWSAQEPWLRSAPLLFPIVGKLKDDAYFYENKKYHLPQHGFARDSVFEVIEQKSSSVKLRLLANPETLKLYPFNFELNVWYSLEDSSLKMTCSLKNLDSKDLLYNFGWHPGFVLPGQSQRIQLMANGDLGSYHRLQNGLIGPDIFTLPREDKNQNQEPRQEETRDRAPAQERDPLKDQRRYQEYVYELSDSLFENDALIFLSNHASEFILKDETGAQIALKGSLSPYFGLWTKDIKKFICLEPWWGHADFNLGEPQELSRKQGISILENEICLAQFEIKLGL